MPKQKTEKPGVEYQRNAIVFPKSIKNVCILAHPSLVSRLIILPSLSSVHRGAPLTLAQSLAAAEPDAPYVYAIRTAAVSQCLYTFFDLLVFPFAAFALLAAPWRTASVYRHMAACVAAEPDSPYVAQVCICQMHW